MSDESVDWRTVGSKPIREDNPSGESVRYEPEFEQLQSELQKLENLSGDPIDWVRVVALSREILERKSKDLLVGCYLTFGLLETERFNGLLNGLTCLEGMISDHWPSLFPAEKRVRARMNALNWLSEKAGYFVSVQEPEQNTVGTLNSCLEQVKLLEDLLNERVSPEEPVLSELNRNIREQLNRIPASGNDSGGDAAETVSKTAAAPPPANVAPAKEPVYTIDTPGDAKRALKEAFSSLKKIAAFTRTQDPARPLPYRLIRFTTWCDIDALPPAENGKSRIPAPPKQLRERFQTLQEQSSWKDLVTQTEAKVPEFPFWLDLHRICDNALAELGREYAEAREAVKFATKTLLARLPGLDEIEFSDGTPFADNSTQQWISTQLFPEKDVETGNTSDATPCDNNADFLSEIRTQSRQLLQSGDHKAALKLIQEAVQSASTERMKFLIRYELVNLCLETGHNKIALVHLETLDEQIARYSLDIWEPELALKVLQIYYRTINKILRETKQPGPELVRLSDSVYGRLCRLDVLAGLGTIK